MNSIIVTILGVMLVTSIGSYSKPTINIRKDVNREQIQKIEAYKVKVEKPLEKVPVYCADYLSKYSWNQEVAYNVMMIESNNIATNLNDNPSTGDYSVGCFQINLLGGNLESKYSVMTRLGYTGDLERDSMKEWLWNPGNNVAVAWELYKASKWQPWSFTTCKKVACY